MKHGGFRFPERLRGTPKSFILIRFSIKLLKPSILCLYYCAVPLPKQDKSVQFSVQFFQHTNSPNPIQLLGYPHWWNPPMILVAKWGTSLSSRVLFTRCYMSQKQRGEMREAYPKLRGISWYSMGILIKRYNLWYNYPKSKWLPSEMMFFAKHTHTQVGLACHV